MSETTQPMIFFDAPAATPRPKTYRLSADLEAARSVTFPPGAMFRVYEDADGNVTGIVVYHETVDADGARRGHENDYSLRPAGPGHSDFTQITGGGQDT